MKRKVCPICKHPEDSDDCYCYPLYCPVCGQPVSWFGEDYGMNTCKHVVVWGTVGQGTEGMVWEKADYEREFQKFWSTQGGYEIEDDDTSFDSEEEAMKAFAKINSLDYREHDDGNPHGHGTGTYVLFQRS